MNDLLKYKTLGPLKHQDDWDTGFRLAVLDMQNPERGPRYTYALFYKYPSLYRDFGDEEARRSLGDGYAQGLRACGFGDRSIF